MLFLFLLINFVVGFFSSVLFITRILHEDVDESVIPPVIIGSVMGFATFIVLSVISAIMIFYRRCPNFFKAKD